MEIIEEKSERNATVISVGDWIITLILTSIPLVNLVMLCIWAFSDATPVSKANWAKASLIIMVIGIVLLVLFWGTIIGALMLGTTVMDIEATNVVETPFI